MSLFKSRRSSVRMIVDSVSKATSVTVTREYVLTVVVPANPISSKSTTPPPKKKTEARKTIINGFRATIKANVSRRCRRQIGWTRETGYNIKTVDDRVGVLVSLNLLT